MSFVVTSVYAALLTLMYVALAAYVIRQRVKHKIGLGDKNQPELLKAIRIHGNFAEYVPLLLLLLALLEAGQAPGWQLHLIGGLGLVGRVLHMLGLLKSSGTTAARLLGMILTFAALLVAAVLLLVR
ncbi:MAPEG family protein [Rheinheimera sp.]|uniref:MAPEG family protein n=1 Tax=Rheinheimera sp. TaxID=1869214 RepID=UPI00307E3D1A